jgi:hypothetical protein
MAEIARVRLDIKRRGGSLEFVVGSYRLDVYFESSKWRRRPFRSKEQPFAFSLGPLTVIGMNWRRRVALGSVDPAPIRGAVACPTAANEN